MGRLLASAAAIAILGLGCGATPKTMAVVEKNEAPSDEDRALCGRLCAKQRKCVGLEVDEAGIERCAAGCFSNLKDRPGLLARLRATASCLDEKCGADYDRCSDHADSRAMVRDDDPNEAGTFENLTKQECSVVCGKTLSCLGAPESARPGCVLGCTEGSRNNPKSIRKYRAVITCSHVPCGPSFQACTAQRR